MDLSTGAGIQDCETCIDMPSVRIDAKREIDFCGLNSTDVEALFPWICFCGSPSSTHTDHRMGPKGKKKDLMSAMVSVLEGVMGSSPEEGNMSNCLSIGCHRIVFIETKVNKTRTEWAQDILHESEGIFAGPMLNEDLGKPMSS